MSRFRGGLLFTGLEEALESPITSVTPDKSCRSTRIFSMIKTSLVKTGKIVIKFVPVFPSVDLEMLDFQTFSSITNCFV